MYCCRQSCCFQHPHCCHPHSLLFLGLSFCYSLLPWCFQEFLAYGGPDCSFGYLVFHYYCYYYYYYYYYYCHYYCYCCCCYYYYY